MIFNILTIFPPFFEGPFDLSLIKRAKKKALIELNIIDLRDYTDDPHRSVDDAPYGGGSGMVMKPEPFFKAYDYLVENGGLSSSSPVIYFTPQGHPLTQEILNRYSQEKELLLICGRYKGVDQRVVESLVTDEISLGDYVISGGELASMVFIEGVTRLIPGAIGQEDSYRNDSFFNGLLDYPHYTRPEEYRGMKVPKVLLSGDHKQIENWRKKKALEITELKRPDLLLKIKREVKE